MPKYSAQTLAASLYPQVHIKDLDFGLASTSVPENMMANTGVVCGKDH